jgi:hypothetical protein
MNEATIRRMLATKPLDVDLGAWLAGQIRLVQETRARSRELSKQAEEDHAWLEAQSQARLQKFRDLQAQCPHYGRSYQADPSGGSDSTDRCADCGKEF